jgi:hypothetical protein
MRRTQELFAAALIVLLCFSCADESKTEAVSTSESSATRVSKALQADRQAEVDAFYLERSDGWNIVDTRITDSGQVVDYVTIETLYPDDPNAPLEEPPPDLPDLTYDGDEVGKGLVDGEDWAYSEFHDNPALEAPEGTLPVIRPNFDSYISGDIPENINTLSEYISWLATPTPSGVQNNRLYVTQGDDKDFYHRYGIQAASGFINVHKYSGVSCS